jgi:hypothetical protein
MWIEPEIFISLMFSQKMRRNNPPLPWQSAQIQLSSPLVGEDGGEGAKEQITLTPTLSRPREREFFPIHFMNNSV